MWWSHPIIVIETQYQSLACQDKDLRSAGFCKLLDDVETQNLSGKSWRIFPAGNPVPLPRDFFMLRQIWRRQKKSPFAHLVKHPLLHPQKCWAMVFLNGQSPNCLFGMLVLWLLYMVDRQFPCCAMAMRVKNVCQKCVCVCVWINHMVFHKLKFHSWLVVYLPLWKMMEFVRWDDDIPNWMESHNPAMFQSPPTR